MLSHSVSRMDFQNFSYLAFCPFSRTIPVSSRISPSALPP